MTRYYDSFNDEDVGFGRGWSITPFHILTPSIPQAHPFCVVREGNEHWIYRYLGANHYVREDGRQVLKITPGQNSTLRLQNGTSISFDTEGKLIHLSDSRGGDFDYFYENRVLREIKHQSGKSIEFIQKGDRIAMAKDSEGKCLTYLYDNQKLLHQIVDDQGLPKVTYEYDQDLRLKEINGSNGEPIFRGEYDDYNRLVSCKWSYLSEKKFR